MLKVIIKHTRKVEIRPRNSLKNNEISCIGEIILQNLKLVAICCVLFHVQMPFSIIGISHWPQLYVMSTAAEN